MPSKQKEDKTAPVESPTVTVSVEQWNTMLDRLSRLEATADRGRLVAFDSMRQKPVNRSVKLSTLEVEGVRKVIMAWRLVKDDVFKGPNGAWVEDQVVEVLFEDDTKQRLSLVDFYRKTQQKISASIISREADASGRETFKVECEDGKTRVIGVQFIN